MEKMWLIVAEILSSADGSSGTEIGFMNITTWSDTKEAASLKIEKYLNSFGWHLVQIERADIIDDGFRWVDEVVDMIERTRGNSNAIILGTFHTYKTN